MRELKSLYGGWIIHNSCLISRKRNKEVRMGSAASITSVDGGGGQ